jgi:hypothetical protein
MVHQATCKERNTQRNTEKKRKTKELFTHFFSFFALSPFLNKMLDDTLHLLSRKIQRGSSTLLFNAQALIVVGILRGMNHTLFRDGLPTYVAFQFSLLFLPPYLKLILILSFFFFSRENSSSRSNILQITRELITSINQPLVSYALQLMKEFIFDEIELGAPLKFLPGSPPILFSLTNDIQMDCSAAYSRQELIDIIWRALDSTPLLDKLFNILFSAFVHVFNISLFFLSVFLFFSTHLSYFQNKQQCHKADKIAPAPATPSSVPPPPPPPPASTTPVKETKPALPEGLLLSLFLSLSFLFSTLEGKKKQN